MTENEYFSSDGHESPKGSFSQKDRYGHPVSVYTVLSILHQMRKELGLEAMLEYLEEYLRVVETYHPDLKSAVSRALRAINVEKMYFDAIRKP